MSSFARAGACQVLTVIALCLGVVPSAVAGSVKFTISCGATASTCAPNDSVKVMVAPEVAGDAAAVAAAQTALKDVDFRIVDRDDPTRSLPSSVVAVRESNVATERLIDLRPVLAESSRRDDTVRAIVYAKPVTGILLQLIILPRQSVQAPAASAPLATLPFTLDMASAYRDGSVGLILDDRDLKCARSSRSGKQLVDDLKDVCQLGDSLQLPIVNLAQWSLATNRQANALVLYLNDIAMTGITGTPGRVISEEKRDTQALRFLLQRDLAVATSEKAWHDLLTAQTGTPINLVASLGADSARWSYGSLTLLQLPRYSWLGWFIGLIAVALVIALGSKSQSLRVSNLLPLTSEAFITRGAAFKFTRKDVNNNDVPLLDANILKSPHSLSRITMALWIVIVSLSFFVLTGLTHSNDLLNTTALSLIGIGGASMVFACAIDSPTDADKQLDSDLAVAVAGFIPGDAGAIAGLETLVRKARDSALISTRDFLRDIFAEKGTSSVDLHRLQMVAFTLFYMGLFLWTLNRELALPDFSTNVLGLLGISTASYLGYKFSAAQ